MRAGGASTPPARHSPIKCTENGGLALRGIGASLACDDVKSQETTVS
jgi:hypothetical protein